ncbi:MAG: hypothetical protein H7315_14165, partial [Herminiimonas sp.]|nr:hypothetical protein [Herminiimonas sp.]
MNPVDSSLPYVQITPLSRQAAQPAASTASSPTVPSGSGVRRGERAQALQLFSIMQRMPARSNVAPANSAGAPATTVGARPTRTRILPHRIVVTDLPDRREHRIYALGQSPLTLAPAGVAGASPSDDFRICEQALVQGIESRQGLYEFVSRMAHQEPARSKSKPVIDQLMQQWQASRAAGVPLVLGGKYQVTSVERQIPPDVGSAPVMNDHLHVHLDVTDRTHGRRHTIVLTQAGLKFTGQLLRPEQILRASMILDQHQELNYHAAEGQAGPMILSGAGNGRNATLVAFREIQSRIEDGSIVDQNQVGPALQTVVTNARQVCAAFIQMPAQLDALHEALCTALERKRNRASEPVTAAPTAADLAAMDRASGRTPSARSEQASGFQDRRFQLKDNMGGGDCLFHALEASGPARAGSVSLSRAALEQVREEVAAVRRQTVDTPQQLRYNHADYATIVNQHNPDALKAAPKSGVITNKHLAYMQRQCGYYAGETELEQWLMLERNRDRMVVVIDSQTGFESITY